MRFKDITGHEELKQRLAYTARQGRISHAQLFLGINGSGNLPLAVAYAQFLCCTDPGDLDSCGGCPSCIKFAKLVHPDVHFIYPVAASKKVSSKPVSTDYITEFRKLFLENPYMNLYQWLSRLGVGNKQGSISVNESRDIIKKLSLKPYEAGFKIMIIWRPEMFHTAAANKLLKMIEEPPQRTVFLLVAEDDEKILKTILSRTQLVKVGRIEEQSLAAAIREKYGLSEEQSVKMAHLSDGSFAEAQKQAEKYEDEEYNFKEFVKWMRMAYGKDVPGLIKWVEEIASIGRERQKHFLEYALHIIRESLMLNFGDQELSRMNEKEREFTMKFSPFINGVNCEDIIEELNQAHYHIERNAYPKILFLDLSFKLIKLLHTKNVTLSES